MNAHRLLLALASTLALGAAAQTTESPQPATPPPELPSPSTPPLPEPPPAPADETVSPPSATAAAPAPADAQVIYRVVFSDGQILRGHLVAQTAAEVVLELAGGGRLTLPRSLIRELVPERGAVRTASGELWFADANRTRYFYSPSAMMLKKGQAYFSQKELVFSSLAYGVTDNFSVIVGTVAPAWFLGLNGINGIIGLKAGAPVVGKLHIAAGLETLVLPGLNAGAGSPSPTFVGLLFGSATWGDADRHVTLSVGKPLAIQLPRGEVFSMDLITTVSANYRVHPHVALMTENWIVVNSFAEGQWLTAHAVGARFLGERIAADLGFVWPVAGDSGRVTQPTNWVPIPWVDFTYNFDFGAANGSE